MNKELYQKIFFQMEKLGAIRKESYFSVPDETSNYEIEKIVLYFPVLSDCITATYNKWVPKKEEINFVFLWDTKIVYLKDQSDILWELLLEKLTND